ncbi:MAG: secondary thiamine-phosphate synthase enzyme YjbQ [Minisyncoccales bacterium]
MRKFIFLKTKGFNQTVDITEDLRLIVKESGVEQGFCFLFAFGSTCALTTIEYEEGLLKDFKNFLEKLLPGNEEYEHCQKWGDCNAVSHLLSSLFKTFLILPVENNDLLLGSWQNVVFIDFDKRPRQRKILVEIFQSSK